MKKLLLGIALAIMAVAFNVSPADAQWGNPPPPVLPFDSGSGNGWSQYNYYGYINGSQQGDAVVGHYRLDMHAPSLTWPTTIWQVPAFVDMWVERNKCSPRLDGGGAGTLILWFQPMVAGHSCRLNQAGYILLQSNSNNAIVSVGTLGLDPNGMYNFHYCVYNTRHYVWPTTGSDYMRIGSIEGGYWYSC